MDQKLNDFLKQLNEEIERSNSELIEAKKKLTSSIENINLNFGIAKYSEQITIIQSKIETLQEQKRRFNYFFNK